jgi:hypothetical protein
MHNRSEGLQDGWSVVDLVLYILLFVELTLKWMDSIGYFGEGRLFAQLAIGDMEVLTHPEHGYYIQGFDPTYLPLPRMNRRDLRKDAIQLSATPGNAANAEAQLNFFSTQYQLPRITTSIINQIMRSLNHSVEWGLLQDGIESIIHG